MTTGLTTAAMLVVMLLHAAFGCCWHHSHGSCAQAQVAGDTAPAVENRTCSDHGHCPCGHDRRSEAPVPDRVPMNDEEPGGGNGSHNCCGEDCQFMAVSAVSLLDGSAPLDNIAVDSSATKLTTLLEAARLARSDGPPGGFSSPKALLTRHCVWRV